MCHWNLLGILVLYLLTLWVNEVFMRNARSEPSSVGSSSLGLWHDHVFFFSIKTSHETQCGKMWLAMWIWERLAPFKFVRVCFNNLSHSQDMDGWSLLPNVGWYSNIINHPPFITMCMGGIPTDNNGWVMTLLYPHYPTLSHKIPSNPIKSHKNTIFPNKTTIFPMVSHGSDWWSPPNSADPGATRRHARRCRRATTGSRRCTFRSHRKLGMVWLPSGYLT